MKTFLPAILLAACAIACVHAFPGSPRVSSDESDEKKGVDTVLVLPPGSRNRLGRPIMEIPDIEDIDDSGDFSSDELPTYFNPFMTSSFNGFLEGMQGMLRRLREQMAGILSHIPDQGVAPWGNIPEGANTTSTTKIIDGHVVTVNESVFTDGDDTHGTVFRVRVIDIKPQNETIPTNVGGDDEGSAVTTGSTVGTEKEDTTPSRSVETVEELDNEIPKNQGDLTA